MNLKIIVTLVTLLIICAGIPLTGSNAVVEKSSMSISDGDTIYVDDDFDETTEGWQITHFDNIQDGVDSVDEGGIVYVYNGTYYEWVIITKTMKLHGEDRDTTIIDGTGILYCLQALSPANNIVITNLTTQNAQSIGVYVSASNSIVDNVTSCWNTEYGFYPRSSPNNVIKNCIGHNNTRGIFDKGTDGLEVYGCTFRDNTDYGMNTYSATTNAYIHHNNFISNEVNVEDVSDGSNLWEYNYYDDYTGEDNNGDGIGDTPYDIPGVGNHDLYPLMKLYSAISPEIADVTFMHSDPLDTEPGFGWENVSCTVTDAVGIGEVKLIVTDPDDVIVEYPMTNIIGTNTYYVNTTFTDEGCYEYYVWADDIYDNDNISPSQQFELPPNEDVDMNGQIQFMDLVAVVIMYGDEGPLGWCREDVDNDGQAQFMDLIQIVLRYGEYWCLHLPEISDVILTASDPLDTEPGIGWENVSCTVTNANIDEVKLIVTSPINGEYLMINIPGTDTYYYYTTFTAIGCYEYYIWADDIYDNYVESPIEQFELPPNEDVDMDGCITEADLTIPHPPPGGWYGPPGWMREDVDNNGAITFMDGAMIVMRIGEYWDQC